MRNLHKAGQQTVGDLHTKSADELLDILLHRCYNGSEHCDGQCRSANFGTGLTHLAGISSKAGWHEFTTAILNRPMVGTF